MSDPTVLDASGGDAARRTALDTAFERRPQEAEPPAIPPVAPKSSQAHRLPRPLDERYQLESLISSGGQADVVRCRDRTTGTEVAVKLYRLDPSPDAWHVVDLVADRRWPHVAIVLDHGIADGRYYEVSRFAEHGSLAALQKQRTLTSTEIRALLTQLASALSAFHPEVLHRDLKPSNILVDSVAPFRVLVTDFGIATEIGDDENTRSRPGSIRYKAPEVLTGIYGRPADWWSVGLIVWEAFVGRSPFVGADGAPLSEAGILRWLLDRHIPIPESIAAEWHPLLRGLLTRRDTLRWGSTEVEAWLHGKTPPDFYAQASKNGSRGATAERSFVFAGRPCLSTEEVAAALLDNPRAARRLVSDSAGLDELTAWTQFIDPGLARLVDAIRRNVDGGVWTSSLRVMFELVCALDPRAVPILDGEEVSREVLHRRASAAARGEQSSGVAGEATVRDLASGRVLLALANFDGLTELAGIDAAWREQLVELGALRAGIPPEVDAVADGREDMLAGLTLLVALDPDIGRALVARALAETHDSARRDVAWFAALADHLRNPSDPAAAAAAILTELLRDEADDIQRRERAALLEHELDEVRRNPPATRQRNYLPLRRSRQARRDRVARRMGFLLRAGTVTGAAMAVVGAARLPLDAALSDFGMPAAADLPARWFDGAVAALSEPPRVLLGGWLEWQHAWSDSVFAPLDLLSGAPGILIVVGVLTMLASALGMGSVRRYRYYEDSRVTRWAVRSAAVCALVSVVVISTLPWQPILLAISAVRRR